MAQVIPGGTPSDPMELALRQSGVDSNTASRVAQNQASLRGRPVMMTDQQVQIEKAFGGSLQGAGPMPSGTPASLRLANSGISPSTETGQQLNALAYNSGSPIHVAPGQDQHLPHEAWHVVQQKQGRVMPTVQA